MVGYRYPKPWKNKTPTICYQLDTTSGKWDFFVLIWLDWPFNIQFIVYINL